MKSRANGVLYASDVHATALRVIAEIDALTLREPAIERRDGIVAMVLVLATRGALGDAAACAVSAALQRE